MNAEIVDQDENEGASVDRGKPLKIASSMADSDTAVRKSATANAMTLINSVIGAGMLALGDSFYRMGAIPALLLTVLSAGVIYAEFTNIVEATSFIGAKTLRQLFVYLFGDVFALIVDICNVVFLVSYLMVYLVVSSQYFVGFLADVGAIKDYSYDMCYNNADRWLPCNYHLYVVPVFMLIVAGFSCIRDLKILNIISAFTPFIAIVTMIILVVIVIISSATKKDMTGQVPSYLPALTLWPNNWKDFMVYVPFLISLYGVQSSLPPMFAEMKESYDFRVKALKGSTAITVPLCTVIYMVMGIVGQALFAKPTDSFVDNILNGFKNPPSAIKYTITVIRLLMAIVCLVSYPAILLPVRASIIRWIPHDEDTKIHTVLFYTIGFVLSCIAMLVAMLYPNIGSIFSLASSLFGIFQSWIAPLMVILYMPRIRKMVPYEQRKLEIGSEMTSAPESSTNASETIETAVASELGTSPVIEKPNQYSRRLRKKGFLKDGKRFKTKLPEAPLGAWRIFGYVMAMTVATVVCIISFVCQLI